MIVLWGAARINNSAPQLGQLASTRSSWLLQSCVIDLMGGRGGGGGGDGAGDEEGGRGGGVVAEWLERSEFKIQNANAPRARRSNPKVFGFVFRLSNH